MYTKFFKKKIENMQLRERIGYGYKKVIIMMLISGILSIAAIGMLFSSLVHYVNKINASDIAVKMCRVDVNSAARNVREMALKDDTSSYTSYEQTIANLLNDVDSQLKIIKNSGVVPKKKYEEYATALSDWETICSSIVNEIKSGQKEKGTEDILTKCTPALNKLVNLALELDDFTDKVSSEAVRNTILYAVVGIIFIIFLLTLAWISARKTSKKVLHSILEPLHAIEDVAKESSTCPSGANGGDLGEFGKGQMVKEFEDAAFAAEIGHVVGPVKTQFGYHLIKGEDKKEAEDAKLDDVKEQIKSEIMQKKQQEAYTAKVEALKKKYMA